MKNADVLVGVDSFLYFMNCHSQTDQFVSFQFGQQTFDAASMAFGTQPPRDYSRGNSPEWLHMQVGGGFDRAT